MRTTKTEATATRITSEVPTATGDFRSLATPYSALTVGKESRANLRCMIAQETQNAKKNVTSLKHVAKKQSRRSFRLTGPILQTSLRAELLAFGDFGFGYFFFAVADRCHDRMRYGLGNLSAPENLGKLFEFLPLGLANRFIAVDIDIAVILHAGAGGNQPAHDHVLFQTAQVINAAGDCRFGKHASRLLERRGRDERVG